VWGDLDNDGWLDLYVVVRLSRDMLYQNNGNSTFSEVHVSAGLNGLNTWHGLGFGDYDGDGFTDIYMPVAFGTDRLYRNNGNSANWLHVNLVGSQSNRAAIGTSVVAIAGSLRMTRVVDGGSGNAVQPTLPVEFGLGASTRVDILKVFWPSGVFQVLTRGDGNQRITVTEATTTSSVTVFSKISGSVGVNDGGPGREVAWGDYDGDGDPDLIVSRSG